MKREPLARVEQCGDIEDRFLVRALLIDGMQVDSGHRQRIEATAMTINAAIEKREAPLLALLALARSALVQADSDLKTAYGDDPNRSTPLTDLARRIDLVDPGEWVPAAKYRELERVLGDLKEERRDVWRERCEKALAYFAERRHAASAWDMANILEGES